MEKHKAGRKSTRTIPVIVENHENATKKTKLMVPSNYTAGHLVNILRSRMHLLPYHPVYLFLKSKQSPVLMSKSIGHLHYKHQDEKGLLRLIHAEQASFGFRGNIRAIRFRQKWIENLHNALHQGASAPPPHFPLDSPGTEGMSDAIVELADTDDAYYEYMANILEMDDSPMPTTDVPTSWTPLNIASFSQSSTFTNSSQSSNSSTLGSWAMSSSLSDPWLPSAATNSGQNPGASNSSTFLNSEEQIHAFNLEMDHVSQSIMDAVASGNPLPPIPNFLGNIQPAVVQYPEVSSVQNPQEPPHLSLYESDSDFYDSDKDVDMDD